MPFQPVTITAGQNPLVQFGGMITTHFLPPVAGTAFQLKQIYRARQPPVSAEPAADPDVADAYRGPPTHFHVHQTERFRVERGRMGIEINGKSSIVTPADGVIVCRAGNLHRFWVDVEREDGEQEDVVLLLNATDSGKDFVLDRVFFENWYGMRYDSLTFGEGIDLVQMLCTFDAGDHYIPMPASLPSFVPASISCYIRTFLGYWVTVLIGRYIGSLLGYRPFFREYTSDWELAQAKAKHTWFHRRNIETSYQQAKSWDELQRVSVWSDESAASMGGNFEKVECKQISMGTNGVSKIY